MKKVLGNRVATSVLCHFVIGKARLALRHVSQLGFGEKGAEVKRLDSEPVRAKFGSDTSGN